MSKECNEPGPAPAVAPVARHRSPLGGKVIVARALPLPLKVVGNPMPMPTLRSSTVHVRVPVPHKFNDPWLVARSRNRIHLKHGRAAKMPTQCQSVATKIDKKISHISTTFTDIFQDTPTTFPLHSGCACVCACLCENKVLPRGRLQLASWSAQGCFSSLFFAHATHTHTQFFLMFKFFNCNEIVYHNWNENYLSTVKFCFCFSFASWAVNDVYNFYFSSTCSRQCAGVFGIVLWTPFIFYQLKVSETAPRVKQNVYRNGWTASKLISTEK